jgi:hypothetical protein
MSWVALQPALAFLLASLCVLGAIALGAYLLKGASRLATRRRHARSWLAGDWWGRFEGDLRAYESTQWRRARARELRD